MILATDVGNSTTTVGLFGGEGRLLFRAELETSRSKTRDQCAIDLLGLFSLYGADVKAVDGAILSSVVPPLTAIFTDAIARLMGKPPMVVGPGIKTGLNIQMDDPASVGSDRIVIAVAALQEYRPPLALVDMGTATTIEIVDSGNTYLGGCIIPGVRVSAEALSSRASQLPGIQLDKPRRVIGKNTVECMRSGIMYGAAAMLDGMLDRIEEELGKPVTVVVTGGMAQFIAPLCKREMKLERDLLLKGLNILYQKNHKS